MIIRTREEKITIYEKKEIPSRICKESREKGNKGNLMRWASINKKVKGETAGYDKWIKNEIERTYIRHDTKRDLTKILLLKKIIKFNLKKQQICLLQNIYLKYSSKRDLKIKKNKPQENKTKEMHGKTSEEED